MGRSIIKKYDSCAKLSKAKGENPLQYSDWDYEDY